MNNVDESLKIKIAKVNRVNPYVDITRHELKVGFPKIIYDSFFPNVNEIIIYVAPAKIFKDKEKVTGHTGNSAGASIRVAKGVSIRTGASGGKAIREIIRERFDGDLIITNKRILFIGKDEHFEFNINKISVIKTLNETSFLIQSGKTSKNIEVDEYIFSYVYGYINFVIKAEANGEDLYKKINEETKLIPIQTIEYCDKFSEEAKNIKVTENKKIKHLSNEEKVKRNFKFFSIFIIALIILVLLINKSSKEKFEIYPYTDTEIINLDNHPRIYDNFQNAQALYSNVNKEKVRVFDLKKERTTAYNDEEKYLVYIENSSTNYEYIDRILLNFDMSDEYKNISLDEVIKIAVDYLPMDIFNQYYQKTRSYIYENNNVISYHYAWKLNEKGIEYHNNGHTELQTPFGLAIVYNKLDNSYTVRLDIFADEISIAGYHSEEWYKKNTQIWNVNLKDYVD
ncbi:MAG: hypothetical protein IKJ32_07005 [Clostridia bacterium]|nr:hypothetical protein [Clostridia bacterium]